MIPAMLVAVIPALVLPWVLLPLRTPIPSAVLPVIPLAWVFARAIARQKPASAAWISLAWAVVLSGSTIAAAAWSPDAAMRSLWHARAYRDEMLLWIATGAGPEGDIARFLPRVLVEYALVLGLSALTVGAGGLLLGSLLLGYMNGYVGWVVANADPNVSPIAAALLAWPPWSIARVASFVAAGTAAASWGHALLYDRKRSRPNVLPLLIASLALLLVDVLLKWGFAPTWRGLLRGLLGASAGTEAGGSG